MLGSGNIKMEKLPPLKKFCYIAENAVLQKVGDNINVLITDMTSGGQENVKKCREGTDSQTDMSASSIEA